MSIEDTGERRRVVDLVSVDASLELVCTLAYENALRGGDGAVIASVERAILKLRQLKLESTGSFPAIDPNTVSLLKEQAE